MYISFGSHHLRYTKLVALSYLLFLHCNPVQSLISFPPISGRPHYLHFIRKRCLSINIGETVFFPHPAYLTVFVPLWTIKHQLHVQTVLHNSQHWKVELLRAFIDSKNCKILLNQPYAKFSRFYTSFCFTSQLFTTILILS